MAPRITPSKAERAEACANSAAGTGIDSTGRYAKNGTAVHRYVDRARVIGREAALAEIPHAAEHRRMCERIRLDQLPWWPGNVEATALVHAERPVAYDPETNAAWLFDGAGRRYEDVGEWQLAGTPDVDVARGDCVDVWDIKTGNPTTPTRAADNLQLAIYALMLCALYGFTRARIGIAFIYVDGSVSIDVVELDAIALYAIRQRVRDTLAKVRAAVAAEDVRPFVKRGDWCKYCPRYVECPAQVQVLKAFLAAARDQEATDIGPADVQATREFVRDAKTWLAKVEETVKDYARVQDVPTDKPGIVYREWTGSKREIVNGKLALKVLRERYGEGVADMATLAETSVGAIESAVEAHAKATGHKAAPAVREAFDAIRAVGAMTDEETRTVREGKADRAA
jgi:hypothetical protein